MTSGEEPGQFDVKFADQNEGNPVTVFSQHTNLISGAAKAAPTGETLKAIPKAFEGLVAPNAKCAGRVLVYFVSDAADTIESEESQWEIPCLIYNLNGQLVGRKTLTQENMTGFTQAGTVDVVCAAGVPARVAYFDVPRGLLYALDPNGKVRAYVGDDA
jgi:hypothetical protein